jgi:predicted GNAT superfamily acetyltransferase
MSIAIRDVREHELDSVLALNNAAGPAILPLDAAKAAPPVRGAEYFRVAERDGALAGFLIGFGADAATTAATSPGSANATRISSTSTASWWPAAAAAAASAARFYADVQSYAELRYPQLACEVFLQQGNDHALLFHGSFGFREVGQHVMPGHDIRAAMLMKGLCSYAWVRDTYGDALPGEPWLPQPRALAQASRPTGTCA